jgi:hypothetical protein
LHLYTLTHTQREMCKTLLFYGNNGVVNAPRTLSVLLLATEWLSSVAHLLCEVWKSVVQLKMVAAVPKIVSSNCEERVCPSLVK